MHLQLFKNGISINRSASQDRVSSELLQHLEMLIRHRAAHARNLINEKDQELFYLKFEIWKRLNEQIAELLCLK